MPRHRSDRLPVSDYASSLSPITKTQLSDYPSGLRSSEWDDLLHNREFHHAETVVQNIPPRKQRLLHPGQRHRPANQPEHEEQGRSQPITSISSSTRHGCFYTQDTTQHDRRFENASGPISNKHIFSTNNKALGYFTPHQRLPVNPGDGT
jgi:hypothetical protein